MSSIVDNNIIYPQIGGTVSITLSIFLTILFVGSIYVIGPGDRNDPKVVKNRFKAVFYTSIIAYLILYIFIPSQPSKLSIFLKIIGINVETPISGILYPLLLTMILFFGPLVMLYLDYHDHQLLPFTSSDFNLYWIRNFVVGPGAEEIVFRSVICPLLFFAGYSSTSIILFSPLLFGLAHVHHIFPLKQKKAQIINQVVVIAFQVVYTSLFGMYSSYIFMRTGNLMSCIIAHSFCNMMGLPNFGEIPYHDKKILLSICFVIGLVGFIYLLPVFTDPLYFNGIYETINNNQS